MPWSAKVLAGAVAGYALSPIDLIPDFIPVLGYLDDLLIVPIGISLALRLIPEPLLREFRATAAGLESRPVSRVAAGGIILLWIAATVFVGSLVWWDSRAVHDRGR